MTREPKKKIVVVWLVNSPHNRSCVTRVVPPGQYFHRESVCDTVCPDFPHPSENQVESHNSTNTWCDKHLVLLEQLPDTSDDEETPSTSAGDPAASRTTSPSRTSDSPKQPTDETTAKKRGPARKKM